eukprot:CAMPEP_0184683908 /NCGR_PEP_ID=MMETSP0312-20130426/13120_1 /TAXON_ID=31354 /ORGANISM="Compsopogon coeruleus, Strain SAG 36.94" /LENGTH=68 /DNA_ID=CAMNT_0027136625 /DNA_START=91 /DNA_END=294 /DNA_ORIENTATION=+
MDSELGSLKEMITVERLLKREERKNAQLQTLLTWISLVRDELIQFFEDDSDPDTTSMKKEEELHRYTL